MAIYRYQHGDRPLDGYTIQHGLGRGGFGEVYYAVSDSGREVALKSVQNYEDIELRGIKHCMNLKNAHLVSIFDIRHNDEGQPFVIMEFVNGPSLRDILDAHPEGLGTAKAAFFLREIAKGLAYLHDCGVVHRDLKPHNVFYEGGVVKIGDYSLSKVISTSHRTGHTVTVGTVHYMAPEISMGRYDHTVDIYALGVLFYEMLTGHPPFIGSSMGEVLMKHVAGDVDVSELDEPYARVIKKALAKEPEQRYQSAQEMIDDLFGHEGLQNSVDALGPESLTFVAEQAYQAAKSPDAKARTDEPQETAAYYRSPAPEEMTARGPSAPPARSSWHKVFVVLAVLGCFAFLRAAGGAGGIPRVFLVIGGGFLVFFAAKWAQGKQRQDDHRRAHTPPPRGRPIPAEAVRPQPQRDQRVQQVSRETSRERAPTPTPAGPDPYAPITQQSSSHDRLVSLILGAIFFLGVPIAGLQRFYVGRVKTGLLWLLTFGLFGIGQIVDMIMIALGQFRDAEGQRVLDFSKRKSQELKQPVNQYSAVVRPRWTESRVGFKLGSLLFNLLGGILLLLSMVVGAIVAVGIPEAVASGAFGNEVAREIANETEVHDWYKIATAVLSIIAVVSGTFAATCLIFARRESSWGHLLRIPVAAAAFVGSVICLGNTTNFGRRWYQVADQVNDRMIGGAVETLFNGPFWPPFVCACLLFILGVFVMAWPARSKPIVVEQQPAQAVHQEEQVV